MVPFLWYYVGGDDASSTPFDCPWANECDMGLFQGASRRTSAPRALGLARSGFIGCAAHAHVVGLTQKPHDLAGAA